MKKFGTVLLMLSLMLILATGCGVQQEAAVPEVEWETIPPEGQAIEVTVSDTALDYMATDWGKKTSNTSLFMLIPGSS